MDGEPVHSCGNCAHCDCDLGLCLELDRAPRVGTETTWEPKQVVFMGFPVTGLRRTELYPPLTPEDSCHFTDGPRWAPRVAE
jgi:hypothetical protein